MLMKQEMICSFYILNPYMCVGGVFKNLRKMNTMKNCAWISIFLKEVFVYYIVYMFCIFEGILVLEKQGEE